MISGGLGRDWVFLSLRSTTLNVLSVRSASALSVWSLLEGRNSLPPCLATCKRIAPWSDCVLAKTSQNSSGTNARISRSRSTSKLTATDCTLPAESPRAILAHNKGESMNPTTRSRNRRVCWAWTLSSSSRPGWENASWTACLVISLNTTRRYRSGSAPITSFRCHAMASPSRSKSVAR